MPPTAAASSSPGDAYPASGAATPLRPVVERGHDVRMLRWVVLACAVLLFLRKPWALHTPQLWAEDGEIFLIQDEQMGVRAWWTPYNGYLHLLPRLIAWTASHVADPRWWPAIYNGLAFALNVALFARLASRRIELPAKAALMLAFVFVVGTGEVLINLTNLQWVTAFFLLLQLFTARPLTALQGVGDLLILLVVGLNGPFAIVFLPLYLWRLLRERRADTALAAAAVFVCALVQGWLLVRTTAGLNLQSAGEPFRPVMFLSILGSRLVTWPLFGPAAVRAWPIPVHAVLAVAFIGPLLAWSWIDRRTRGWQRPLVAAFALITFASVYRVRADTWADDNLINGDRYFYIPRVLLAWLVIGQLGAPRRWLAWTARVLVALAIVQHLPRFVLPAPRDYHWAEHCDAIRRGVPANIYTLPEGWWMEYPGRPKRH